MNIHKSGIVRVQEWEMLPDGFEYVYIFCKNWEFITHKDISNGINFNPRERWALLALNDKGEILALFPGCQVLGFIKADKPPKCKKRKGQDYKPHVGILK